MNRKLRSKPRARKYISKRKAVRKAKKSNFVKAVKAVISQQAEDKIAYTTNTWTKYNQQISTTSDILSILPGIGLGTGSSQRIGNKIRGKSLNIKGHLRLDYLNIANDTKYAQVAVRFMIVSLKPGGNQQYDTYTAAPLSSLLERGGTVAPFQGYIEDLYSDLNTEVWTKHYDKVMYLSQTYINQPAGAGLTAIPTEPRNALRFFNINIPCKKLLHFDTNISGNIYPTNFNPVLLMGYSLLDNSTPEVSTTTKIGMQYVTTFKFEDI